SQPGTNLRTALSDGYISVYWGANVAIRQAEVFNDLPVAKLQTGLGRIAQKFLLNNAGSAYLAEPAIKDLIQAKTLFYVKGAPVFKRRAFAIYHKRNNKVELLQRLIGYLDLDPMRRTAEHSQPG
ncbi:MAG: hypothetical protein HKN85_12175, partial [Gammaproteobacteria bacterium]|nr:hypothetical protein [Gammaproteobacteria bacterium]